MSAVVKKRISEYIFDYANTIFLIIVCIVTIYPILNIAAISTSADTAVLRGEVTVFPIGANLNSYRTIFNQNSLIRAYMNTIIVATLGVFFSMIMTSFASYPLAFSDFKGKKSVTLFFIFTMWFSGGMIPTYLVVREMGLLNSLAALIIVNLVNAYNVIILTSYFKSLPVSLAESAKIDGANDFKILFSIIIPISKPVIATVSLWILVAHWNDFFGPLMYLRDYRKYTLQVVLRDIVLLNSGRDYGIEPVSGDITNALPEQIKNAVIFASLIPMLAVYPFLQKFFVKGVMIGALKG